MFRDLIPSPTALRHRALATPRIVRWGIRIDIAPAWLHPGRNTPVELPRIAAELASLRGLTADQVAAATTVSAGRVLPRLGA